MENVPEVVGKNNIEHFKKWEEQLRKFGYSNYVETLNGKNYGIPQNRKRTFMISILGEYAYDFPCKIPLKYRLKDLLEKQVDEKYYLSQKMIDYISATGTKDFSVNNSKINCSIGRPLTTEQSKRAGTTNYICDDLPNDFDLRTIAIKNATEQGYLLAKHSINPINSLHFILSSVDYFLVFKVFSICASSLAAAFMYFFSAATLALPSAFLTAS